MLVITTPQFEQALDRMLNCSNDIYAQKTSKTVYDSYKHYRKLLSSQPYIGAREPLLYNTSVSFRRIIVQPYFKFIYIINNNEVMSLKFTFLMQYN